MATATTTDQLCRNYINGEWVESKSTKIVERRNPANTDEVVARIALSTREEMKQAIVAAKAAFPAWRETPAPNRGKILFKATQIMQEQKEELARLLTREEGKALKDSLGEVQRAINIMEFMAGEARRLNGETLTSELPKNFSYTIRQPLGVVGAITPWNFPVAIPVWKSPRHWFAAIPWCFKPANFDAAVRHANRRNLRAGRVAGGRAEPGDGRGTKKPATNWCRIRTCMGFRSPDRTKLVARSTLRALRI